MDFKLIANGLRLIADGLERDIEKEDKNYEQETVTVEITPDEPAETTTTAKLEKDPEPKAEEKKPVEEKKVETKKTKADEKKVTPPKEKVEEKTTGKPKPEQTEKVVKDESVTFEYLTKLCREIFSKAGNGPIKKAFNAVGIMKLPELKEEDYAKLANELKAIKYEGVIDGKA
jgi:hypothetical protein